MADLLRDLPVLVVDCQASGATPAHGDLLELAWARSGPDGLGDSLRSHFIIPRSERRVSAAVREITGWSEARLAESVPEEVAFQAFLADVRQLNEVGSPVPTVIHVARFELPFLRDLYARLTAQAFPLDVVCAHAIATRLFPDLPRRNIRALAGFLGHSVELTRSAAGHVQATAFIWRALVAELSERGVQHWAELASWLQTPVKTTRSKQRTFPLASERRRALPDRPGVYRFMRKNGDVLYVGKATSLKKRIAGHFKRTGPHTERALEFLTQVHDIVISETPSTLEAALLETDEIKRLDPPYNVQLRVQERQAWFASRKLDDVRPAPDDVHGVGPLPSRGALSALSALDALLTGNDVTPRLLAMALAVPTSFLPDAALFEQGFAEFALELERAGGPRQQGRAARAARTLWLERRRAELDESGEDLPEGGWDLARVRRRLDRNLIQAGLVLRRACWLTLLSEADVAFRERAAEQARALSWSGGEIGARHELVHVRDLLALPVRPMRTARERRACFDASRYDRLRVLSTELARIHTEGGEVLLRFGAHVIAGERLSRLMRLI
jgi:DNA polymerase-3 subunit epsilon